MLARGCPHDRTRSNLRAPATLRHAARKKWTDRNSGVILALYIGVTVSVRFTHMNKAFAIRLARDHLPARRFACVRTVVAALVLPALVLPAAFADPVSRAKRTGPPAAPPIAKLITVPADAAPAAVLPIKLSAATSPVGPTAAVDTTGAIVGIGIGGKAVALPLRVAPLPLQRAAKRDWYPESHAYLRPYHYHWRYWTPG